ncbi:MAG: ABC transporter permease [Bacteroidales bacterium]
MKKIRRFLSHTSAYWYDELKIIFHDWGAILVFFVAILVYTVIYSIAYKNEVLREIPVALVDLDHSATSRHLGRMIDATEQIHITLKPTSLEEARELFYQGKINGIVLIPDGFEKELLAGQQTMLPVYCDASYFLYYKQVYSGVISSLTHFNGLVKVQRALMKGMSHNQAIASAEPIAFHYKYLFNPAGGYGSFVMPGIILIILQQTLLIGIGLLGGTTRERNYFNHHLQEKIIPGGAASGVLGKSLAYLTVYLFTSIYALYWVYHWFQFPDKGELLTVALLMVPYLLAVAFMGLAISVLFKERVDALMFMVFLSPIVLFLSGLSWPTTSIPPVLYQLGKIFPSTHMVPAYVRVRSMGAGPADITSELLTLWLQAGIYFILAVVSFTMARRRFLKTLHNRRTVGA